MKNNRTLILGSLVALFLLTTDSDSYGQRGGRGGGVAGGARGGYVTGPYGGGGGGASRGGTVVGPAGGSASRGATQGSYTTGRGTTIDYAGAGRKATGPGGVTAGRGAGGVQVTTPGGQTHTKVGTAGGVAGPGGRAAVGGSSIGVSQGSRGTAVTGSRGGAAIGPGGAVAGGTRGAAVTGPYGLSGYTTTRGAAVTRHGTAYVSRTTLHTQAVTVRRSFVHYNCFTPAWYRTHVTAWRPVAWTAAAFWVGATWATVSQSCGYPAEPVVYDYGTTLVYEDNRVYYNGEPVATAEEYTEQAGVIAAKGQEARASAKDDWVALGVFGMVQGDEKDANKIFQLAINKEGIIRGNYYDALTDTTVPVVGSVDSKTQRAAWTVGERKETVYETGIANLSEAETTMLVHFGKDRTQQWTLVRLEAPEETK